MKIDNHIHIGVEPLFYLNGWSPFCLDLTRMLEEAEGTGIDAWVTFPFVSYFALDLDALREQRIELSKAEDAVPYRFENNRLFTDISRLDEANRKRFLPFLMADPSRKPSAQVREWEQLTAQHPAHGIKIQPTIIQSPILSLLEQGACMLDFAEKNDLPFLIHSSIDPVDTWSQCADILRVVESRPNLRFILAHSCRFHHESLKRVAELPNAWFDCSAHIIHCKCATQELPVVAAPEERFPTDYPKPKRVLRDLAEAYPEKLIWGSDAPFYTYEGATKQLRSTYRDEVDVLDSLPPELHERVSHTNTLAWLGKTAINL